MKNILVPVDYSPVSKNALQYAMGIAKMYNGKITLLHVFHIPVANNESVMLMPNFSELESAAEKSMNEFKSEVFTSEQSAGVESYVKAGFLIEEMKEIIADKKIDLVVMGVTGVGKLGEMLIGSNATIAIHNLNVQVLIVPKDATFKPIEKIAFACDYEKATSTASIEKVKEVASMFDAQLHVLNVVDKDEVPEVDKAVSAVKLEVIMNNIRHTLSFPESEDITYAINEFVDKHDIDMLVMIPHKHRFLGGLFHKSNTKKMAFHTHVPLLSINE